MMFWVGVLATFATEFIVLVLWCLCVASKDK